MYSLSLSLSLSLFSSLSLPFLSLTHSLTLALPTFSSSLSFHPLSLHRIGRTGRFGRSGLAINFVDGPRSRKNMQEIAEHFGRKVLKLDIEDPDKIEEAIGV